MSSTPGVDDRFGRVRTHPGRAHVVPAGRPPWRFVMNAGGTCRAQYLSRSRDRMIEHALAVVAERVLDFGRWNAIRVP